jgi:hypothetical protein
MPWAPEWGSGGLTFFDVSDPCNPSVFGSGYSEEMRESHSIGFSPINGRWAVVDGMSGLLTGGVQFWDVSDPMNPTAIHDMDLPGFRYPDAYARVTLSVFWQAPYLYVAGADNGIYVIDAFDPMNPQLITQVELDPVLRAGQVQAIGNLLVITAAEGPRTVLLDISDPAAPQPIPGGEFLAADATGAPREAYFTNFEGGYIYNARKDSGGGLMIWDVRDPSAPVFSGDIVKRDEEGFLYFVSRKDEMIKTSGYRVSPTEIEEVAYSTGLVGDAVALGFDDDRLGQKIVLAVSPINGAELLPETLLAEMKAKLPLYMVPKSVVVKPSLPRSPNNKFDRTRIRQELAAA